MVRRNVAGQRVAAALTIAALLLGMLGASPVRALAFVFNVNSTADLEDDDLANPSCHASNGKCTLRAAVGQASLLDPGASHHTINVPAGTYTLSLDGVDETFSNAGDLNVRYDMSIVGAGSSKTYVQASTTVSTPGIDRLFMVNADTVDLSISNMTLRRGNGFGDGGGAIRAEYANGSVTLDKVVITNNRTTNKGSAIKSLGNLTIKDSYISNNTSLGATVEHGIGNLTISRSTFTGNTNGTGTVHYTGEVGVGLVDRSTFYDNHMGLGGYGIAVGVGDTNTDDTTLTVRNSTISGNHGNGPALRALDAARLRIESSTIAGNDGFGVKPSPATNIKNSIFAGNADGNCDSPLPDSDGHNLDTGTTCGFTAPGDIENGDPKLGSLKDNGGPTWTRGLASGSEARDAGADCPTIDQRGSSRPKDGNGDGVKTCDIGAYEASPPSTATPAPPSAPPTVAPTVAPTSAPTTAPTEAPPTDAPPSGEPAGTDAPAETAGASTEPTAAASPGESPGGPAVTPGPTAAPAPASDGLSETSILWIVIGVMAVLLAFGLGGMVRRRSSR